MDRSRLALAACLLLACGVAGAQRYPEKPVRMIVPFQPGGGSDTVGRALARGMSERLGQPIVVENRVGAAGSIGAEFAARQPADGYTILLGSTSELTQYPVVNPKIRYDPVREDRKSTRLNSSHSQISYAVFCLKKKKKKKK